MVTLTKGTMTIDVPKSCVTLYVNAGWTPMSDLSSQNSSYKEFYTADKENITETADDENNENFGAVNATSLSEIPLSEMTTDQLIAYADELGVALQEGMSKKQIRDAVKKAL